MNKKGFTLVEIVVCISLLAIIGVGSFVGIRLVDKHIKITKLQQMSDKILQAANVYLETDKEANKELYTNKNGVIIPVRKLVNEGLIDVGNINLNDKTDYVIALLGSEDSNSKCTGVYTATEWDLGSGKTIYICTDSKGNSNLATIDPTKYGNKTYVSNEPYYFKGLDPNNWVEIEGQVDNRNRARDFRIVYVDRDDTIIVVAKDRNGIHINGTTLPEISVDYYSTIDGEQHYEYFRKSGDIFYEYILESWLFKKAGSDSMTYKFSGSGVSSDYPFYRLPKECKIKSGTGARDNKFIVKCN